MKRLFTFSAILFAACGDDNKATPDASVMADADTTIVDAPPDAPPMQITKPTPIAIALSATGPDQLMSVAPGPSGSFYAAGYAAATPTGDKLLVLAKLTAAGALDTTFAGGTGFYTSTLVFKGGSDEIDVAVQSDGKIVVAGTIANNTNPLDKDIGLFRVDATGAIDNTFGVDANGTARVNLSTAFDDAGTLKSLDSERGLAVGPNDTLFLHAASRNDVANAGARIDTDFTVARLSSTGVLDTSYGLAATPGRFLLDLAETDNVATAKGLKVLDDGSVIASGYAKTTTSNATGQPVLYRVAPGGAALDANFALFHEVVLTLQTEIYAFAIDNNNITTAGYGRSTEAANVWASMRFNVTTGARDTSFGGTTDGVVRIDPSGTVAGSNCRNAIGLQGGKTALIGSAGASGARDAALAVIAKNGQLEPTIGVFTFDLAGPEDQWWGGAVNGATLLIAGWKGFGATQSDTANDDAHVVLIPQ